MGVTAGVRLWPRCSSHGQQPGPAARDWPPQDVTPAYRRSPGRLHLLLLPVQGVPGEPPGPWAGRRSLSLLDAIPWVCGEAGDPESLEELVPLCLGWTLRPADSPGDPGRSSSSCLSSDHTPRTLPLLSRYVTRLCRPERAVLGWLSPRAHWPEWGGWRRGGWARPAGHPHRRLCTPGGGARC